MTTCCDLLKLTQQLKSELEGSLVSGTMDPVRGSETIDLKKCLEYLSRLEQAAVNTSQQLQTLQLQLQTQQAQQAQQAPQDMRQLQKRQFQPKRCCACCRECRSSGRICLGKDFFKIINYVIPLIIL
jgi:hypothetical protein